MSKNKKCPAYDVNTEIVRKIIGYSTNGPIWAEKELIVSEYCSMKSVYDFDCTDCPYYKSFEKGTEVTK